MIKRTSRNFKVPLVYGGQWKDHQSFQKWDPVSKRLITVNCCLPQKCFQPEPVTNVTLTSMVSGSAVVSWNYSGPSNVLFELNIYQGLTEPVDTSGTPIYTVLGGISGAPYYFNNMANLYYVASIRVRNDCLFSNYAYSSAVQYIFSGYNFVNTIYSGNPPSNGTMWLDVYHFPSANLGVSVIDSSSNDVSSWLYSMVATSTYIKIQKDLSNYVILQRVSNSDNGPYWIFDTNIYSSAGALNNGDILNITTM